MPFFYPYTGIMNSRVAMPLPVRVTSVSAVLLLACASLWGQNAIGKGKVTDLYNNNCASCHGADLEGGLGGPLVGDNWDYVKDYDGMAAYIAEGNIKMGMPPFGETLSPKEIRSLVIFIREKNSQLEKQQMQDALKTEEEGVFQAGGYRFRVEDVVTDLKTPWSVAFLPDGRMLINEKRGTVRIAQKDGTLSPAIEGTPKVWDHGQGGLLEVALHPDYADNGWVYLGYNEYSGKHNGEDWGMTKVVRGKIKDGQWVDEEVIFEVPPEYHSGSGVHFGTRFVFKDGYLFFPIGERGRQDFAQDLDKPNGKVYRIYDDGRIPEDNPFADKSEAFKGIWSYGHRNPQGLDLHPVTGDIWEAEHGPRGGDEVNLIERGKNYGWPVITYGMNYNGTPITEKTSAPGMEQPKHYWVPSIAVCGIDFYEGDLFPDWKNNLFAGGLASQELHRLVIEDGKVVKDEIIVKGLGRVRDVASAPDGSLMLVLNGPDKIVRLVPVRDR